MIKTYRIQSGGLLAECDKSEAEIVFYSQPSNAEKQDLMREYDMDPLDMESIYDPDEVPRMELSPGKMLLIWKCPDNVSRADTIVFEVSSVGLLLNEGRLIIIDPSGRLSFTGREFKRTASIFDFMLNWLLHTIHHYQGHLKAIKLMSKELQEKVVTSMGNKYLLQMFTLGESLIYYHNALESNHTVLGRMRAAVEKLKFSTEQVEMLDDLLIENQQASKQAGIYSMVLSGLMDARGTIINNNMNALLKNLTIINVVFLPLNLIAGIFGMSEYTLATQGVHFGMAYGVFFFITVIFGVAIWWWLVKFIERRSHAGNGAGA